MKKIYKLLKALSLLRDLRGHGRHRSYGYGHGGGYGHHRSRDFHPLYGQHRRPSLLGSLLRRVLSGRRH